MQNRFRLFCDCPYADEVETDVDAQQNTKPLTKFGGFDFRLAGSFPWQTEIDGEYPIGRSKVSEDPDGFWLMVESGDVDWANHANNIDNSIGAVFSGEAALEKIFNWIEARDAWEQSLVIVTSDHGHFFHLLQPEVLTTK